MMYGLMRNNFFDSMDPFREMEQFERSVFPSFFGNQDLAAFKTDLTDNGDHYVLEADLPGFDKKDIDLELQDNVLTVRAERHSKLDQKEHHGTVLRQERSYGKYSRQFDMTGIDVDHISAAYENGVLKLNLPKLQNDPPTTRRVEIA